ncbi:hypothetical protein [Pseudofrankia inefficax]|uniref:Uncharacterized protein n=1 Tax=Pseudofrankia inefficax (strain DSM 45817 / CECT 9037 / DDB 130130 / EuI1c) TaxID=298654 RepID=E3J656_PSEI1|nr:hypothetical protein [Pseudofrankia inefficax]ADP78347.1 hypothetical protein FraEuI1c_0261 [Pseudofrankia inefficax]
MASGGTNVGRLFATLDLDTNAFTSGLARAGTMFASFGRGIATGSSYAAAGAAALQGIGGAVAVIGQIAPAAALAVPALIGIGAAMFTVKGAFSGVLSAVKAYGQQTGSAANTSRQAEQAAHGLITAQWGLASATNAYNTAVKEAKQNLADLQKLVDRAPTDMEQASLDLREAQENLAKVQSNGFSSNDQIEEARLAVTRAQYAFEDQTDAVKKNQDALATAQAQGVDGNQSVIDAVHQLTQAQWALADAQRQAQNPAGPNAYAQAMAKLPPLAQAFARQIIALRPQLDQLKVSASSMFVGMGSALRDLDTNFPVVNAGVRQLGESIGTVAARTGALFKGAQTQAELGTLMSANATSTLNFGSALGVVGRQFLTIGAVAAPILANISGLAGGVADKFAGWVQGAAASGQLQAAIQGALGALGQLAQVVTNVGAGLASLFSGIGSSGAGTLNTLVAISQAFREIASNTALQSIIQGLGSAFSGVLGSALTQVMGVITGLLPSIQAIMPALQQVLPIFLLFAGGPLGPLLKIVGVMGLLGPLADTIGQVLGQAMTAVAPLLGALGTAFTQLLPPLRLVIGSLIQSLMPVISQLVPPLTKVATAIGGALVTVLGTLMTALQPVIPVIGSALVMVVSALADVIVQSLPALNSLIQSIVSLLPPLLPLIPAILGLVVAVLPLIPAVLQIAAAILQALMPVIVPLISLLVQLISWFVELNTRAVGLVVGLVTDIAGWLVKLIGHFGDLPGLIGKALSGLEKLITAPFKAAFNAVSDLWNRSLGSIHFTVPNWVPGVGGKGFSFPTLPKLAKGGTFASSGLAIVGDDGPEILSGKPGATITPLSRASGGGGGIVINMSITHNGMISDKQVLDDFAAKIVGPLKTQINRYAASNGGSAGLAA